MTKAKWNTKDAERPAKAGTAKSTERVKRFRAKRKLKVGPPTVPATPGLTAKQTRFAQEYSIDFNAHRAAIRAGYSEASARTIGRDTLQVPGVRAAVEAVRETMRAHFAINATDVLAEIHAKATSSMEDYQRLNEHGQPVIDLSNLTRRQWSAISELQVEEFTEGRGREAREVRRTRIKLSDALPALVVLTKLCGIGEPDPDRSGGPGASVEAMQREAEARARKMPDAALKAIADLIRQQRAHEAAALAQSETDAT